MIFMSFFFFTFSFLLCLLFGFLGNGVWSFVRFVSLVFGWRYLGFNGRFFNLI